MSLDSRHFSTDPLTGIVTTFHYDDATDECILSKEIDIESLLEANKYLTNTEEYKTGSELRRVASIPMVIYQDLINRRILNDPEDPKQIKFHKWLNDPDNRFFRVNEEKLGTK